MDPTREAPPRRLSDACLQAIAEDAFQSVLTRAVRKVGLKAIVTTLVALGGVVWAGGAWAANTRRDINDNTRRIAALEATVQAMNDLKASVDSLNKTLRQSRPLAGCVPVRPCP